VTDESDDIWCPLWKGQQCSFTIPRLAHMPLLTVLELSPSTQLGKSGKASFWEPSPFFTRLQVSKSADSATWMCTSPPMVLVAKAYQRLSAPMIAGST
jgi:hypothetical protein